MAEADDRAAAYYEDPANREITGPGRKLKRDMSYDDLVDRWHDTNGEPDGYPVELNVYLGMGEDEYSAFLRGEDELERFRAERFAAPD